VRLVSAQVQLFRSIIDSTEVEIDSKITCLVGKNESGKTAFLQALYGLKPERPNFSFSVPDHYPAWLEKKHRQLGHDLDSVDTVAATFELAALRNSATRSQVRKGRSSRT